VGTDRGVTHRLVRHCKRVEAGAFMREGAEPQPFTRTTYEAVCACGHVYQAETDLAASAAYLAHLPKPATTKGH
jgi:hypothetical protein